MINIYSFSRINDLEFGATEAEAVAAFGIPEVRRKNHEGEQECRYKDFILRFENSTGRFRECTLLPGCEASINGVHVAWDNDFIPWLFSKDSDLKEAFGFIVSLKLGIVASGFHDGDEAQKAIHAFRRGDWDMFGDRMKPFVPDPA